MYSFDRPWTDVIAETLGTEEWQTAKVELWDTSIKPEYDIETGKWEYPVGYDPVLYEGQARVIFPRWGVFSGGEGQANAKTNTTARVQIPKDAVGRVNRGLRFKVVAAPNNPSVVGRWLLVTSDVQGSSSANRTFECSFDMDQAPADLALPVTGTTNPPIVENP